MNLSVWFQWMGRFKIFCVRAAGWLLVLGAAKYKHPGDN